jgi:hypothetical protein
MTLAMITASLIGLLAVARSWAQVRGSTLVGPWFWMLVFLSALVAVSAFGPTDDRSMPMCYAVACLSFCPAISLLGAKRPQDTMWHLVVATFAGMMVLPVFEVLVLRPGQALELLDLRGWFVWGLVLGCWVNRWGTRLFLPATLFFAAQLLALAPLLPAWKSEADYWAVAVILWSLAAVVETLMSGTRKTKVHRWDALWLDYRDRFGVVWAARVRERVNSMADRDGWDFELSWRGFRSKSTEAAAAWDPEKARKLVTVFANVLRRFLSAEELKQRADELLDGEEPIDV